MKKSLLSIMLAIVIQATFFMAPTYAGEGPSDKVLLVKYDVNEIIEAENLTVGAAPNDSLTAYGIEALNAVGGNTGGSIIRNQSSTLNTNAISFNYGAYTADKDRGGFTFENDRKNKPPFFDDQSRIYITEMDFTAQTQGSAAEPVRFWMSFQGESNKEIARLEFLKEAASNNSNDPVYFVDSEQNPLENSNQLIFKLRRVSSTPGNAGRLKVAFNMEDKTYSAWLGTYDTIGEGANTATPDFTSVPQMEPLIIDAPFLDQSVTRYRKINLRTYTEEKTPTMFMSFYKLEVFSSIFEKDRVPYDKEELTLGDISDVTSDFPLPLVGGLGSSITWKSNNEKVIKISGDTAIVTQPIYTAEVMLTATLKYGDYEDTKTFLVHVRGSKQTDLMRTGVAGSVLRGGPFYHYKQLYFKDLFEGDGSNGTNGTVGFQDGGMVASKTEEGIHFTAKSTQTAGSIRGRAVFEKTYELPEITELGYQYYVELLVNDSAMGAVTYDFGKNGDRGVIQVRRKDSYSGTASTSSPIEAPAAYVFLRNGEPICEASFEKGEDNTLGFLFIPPLNKVVFFKNGVRVSDLVFDFAKYNSAFETLTIRMFHSIGTTNMNASNMNFTLKSLLVYQGEPVSEQSQVALLDKDDFKFSYLTEERQTAVKSNLHLPSQGNFGSTITWKSSNEQVINPQTGEVTRGETDETVKLTATFTAGDGAEELPFVVVVKGKSEEGNVGAGVYVSMDTSSFEPLSNLVDGDYSTYIETTNGSKKPVITIDFGKKEKFSQVKLHEGLVGGTYSIISGFLEVSDDGLSWKKVADINGVGSEQTYSFEPVYKRYLRFTVTNKAQDKTIKLYELGVFLKATPSQLAAADANKLKPFEDYIVSQSTSLQTTGIFGSTISWSINPSGIISNTGTVTRPEYDTLVTLTATVTNNGTDITKSFTHQVSGTRGSKPDFSPGQSPGRSPGAAGGGILVNLVDGDKDTQVDPPTENGYFKDVKESHWAFEYIADLHQSGIAGGDGSGYFYPSNAITREEFLKMLMLTLKIDPSDYTDDVFADVDSDAWYAEFVYAGYQMGICNGVTDTEFGIGQPISRQDMTVLTVRAINMLGIKLPGGEGYINDSATVSEYAKDSVTALVNAGIITGDENADFNPFDKVLREQAAKILSIILALT